MGIDGRIYPLSSMPQKSGKEADELDFMDVWYPLQVKQKDKAGRPDIDMFEAVLMRENRTKGFFIAFDFSSDALREIDAFFRREHRVIVPLTVREYWTSRLRKARVSTSLVPRCSPAVLSDSSNPQKFCASLSPSFLRHGTSHSRRGCSDSKEVQNSIERHLCHLGFPGRDLLPFWNRHFAEFLRYSRKFLGSKPM